jgi:uncharacterized damage-inducible protein DinB
VTYDTLLALTRYNAWANRMVLEAASALSADEFTRPSSPSHGSVQSLLVHMLECEALFLALSRQEAFDGLPPLCDIASIGRYWDGLGQRMREYAAGLDADAMGRVLEVEIAGSSFRLPVWQLLSQAIVHSVHHRGELSIVLTGLGHPLPTMDILLHFIEQSGQVWPADHPRR